METNHQIPWVIWKLDPYINWNNNEYENAITRVINDNIMLHYTKLQFVKKKKKVVIDFSQIWKSGQHISVKRQNQRILYWRNLKHTKRIKMRKKSWMLPCTSVQGRQVTSSATTLAVMNWNHNRNSGSRRSICLNSLDGSLVWGRK